MSVLLSKVEECWRIVTPEDRWTMWLARDKRFEEEKIVSELAGNNGLIVDIGCGSGRYAHCLKYESYEGFDTWENTVAYAEGWAKREYLSRCTFQVGGVYSNEPYQLSGNLYLTMNVVRHFRDPMAAYRHIWDHIPKGAKWITDFLTHPGNGLKIDDDYSSVIGEQDMVAFLAGKSHFGLKNWMEEVGSWWLAMMTK